MKKLLFILFLSSIHIFSQNFSLKGKVIDSQSGSGLSFANIRVEGTTLGTASNANGEFELKLNEGNYKLIASFIGYFSDTISVNVSSDL
ncbi:MAG: carboxypeptidase-like regulatory domain-containing protein, partial [Ignavibacterium sp.]